MRAPGFRSSVAGQAPMIRRVVNGSRPDAIASDHGRSPVFCVHLLESYVHESAADTAQDFQLSCLVFVLGGSINICFFW